MAERTPTTETIRNNYSSPWHETSEFTSEKAREEFNRWLAAHDAEVRAQTLVQARTIAEVRAGVLAEEPEWEYGVTTKWGMHAHPYLEGAERYAADVRAEIERGRASGDLTFHGRVMKRTKAKAGPWVPVKQEGVTSADR